MRMIHLDAVGGIAGDMFVAAMLDAFPDLQERVLADAAAVLPPDAGKAQLSAGSSGALRALRFGLDIGADHATSAISHGHDDDHDGHHHHHNHASGKFRDLVVRIKSAQLHEGTAQHAEAILTIIAKAEAAIHQTPLDDVHFHEIADWDSLLDVVAAGSIIAALGSTVWTVSSLPRGAGLVRTQHGLLPVPAPATAAILEGFNWRDDQIGGERVTPTGAAILRHLSPAQNRSGEGRLVASGSGAGTRELVGLANILRALVFEQQDHQAPDASLVTMISFEVDDMTGEEIGAAAERLRLEHGVLDVTLQQRWGKKGRPVESFQIIVKPECAPEVANACFEQTATIGLRLRDEQRIVLARENRNDGKIAVKLAHRPGGHTAKAESDHLMSANLRARRKAAQQAEAIVADD